MVVNNLKIAVEAINRIVAVLGAVISEPDAIVKMEIGIAKIDDKVSSRLTYTSKTGQAEIPVLGVPDVMPEGTGTADRVIALAGKEFLAVLSAIAEYESEVTLTFGEAALTVSVPAATVDLGYVSLDACPQVLKNRNNHPRLSEIDTDEMMLSVPYKGFAELLRKTAPIGDRVKDGNLIVTVRDAEPVYAEQTNDAGEVIRKVMTSNGMIEMLAMDGVSGVWASTLCRVKKGIANQILKKVGLPAEGDNVLLFEKDESGEPKPKVVAFADFVKERTEELSKSPQTALTLKDGEYAFGLSLSSAKQILKIASIAQENVQVLIGTKYVSAILAQSGVSLQFPRPKVSNVFVEKLKGFAAKAAENTYDLDVAELAKAVKVQTLKAELTLGSTLAAKCPINMQLGADLLTMEYENALSEVKYSAKNTKLEAWSKGINGQYLKAVTDVLKNTVRMGVIENGIFSFSDPAGKEETVFLIPGTRDAIAEQAALIKQKNEKNEEKKGKAE